MHRLRGPGRPGRLPWNPSACQALSRESRAGPFESFLRCCFSNTINNEALPGKKGGAFATPYRKGRGRATRERQHVLSFLLITFNNKHSLARGTCRALSRGFVAGPSNETKCLLVLNYNQKQTNKSWQGGGALCHALRKNKAGKLSSANFLYQKRFHE